jgi:outer membrane protein TolC
MPRLDFVGSYGYAGLDPVFSAARAQIRDRDARAYSAGLVVSVPLTFAEGRGRARAATLGLRQSEAELTRLEHDIAVDVTTAAGQLQTTHRRVAATRTAYELAKLALDSEEKRFRAGTSRTLDVLQLQEQLAAVESAQVRALADERRALATYERELGLTLARRGLTTE